jgi:hypothetical protein
MNKKNTLQITAIISMALLGCNYASAQTVPDTHNDNISDLGNLNIGTLPAGISTVVTNLQGYQAAEEAVAANLRTDIANTQNVISNIETAITTLDADAVTQQTLITNLIIADPLDPQIVVEQANLALIQADIVTANNNLANTQGILAGEQADLADSELKIALFQSALDPTGPVQAAQDAASAAAAVITQAVTEYSTVNSNPNGLEDVIADIASVTAGDQVPVTTAITNADTAFAASGGTLADIQTFVGVIDTELPTLPAISAVDQQTAINEVTDGAYERVAIADNATNIGVNATAIANETTRATAAEGANTTAIGVNATAIANETTRATAAEGANTTAIGVNATAIGVNTTAIGVNATAIANETTRATAAEGANTTAIGVNATAIANEVVERDALINRQVDGIHIGANSFILDDTAGAHVLTTDDGSFTLGGGAVTEVDVDADLDVDGDIFTSGDVFVGGRSIGLQSQIDSNREDIDRNARGIAMVAALQHTTVLPGMTQALDLSAAHFEGETGMALNYARRINENVQINFGAASTSDFDESVIKAGIGVQW